MAADVEQLIARARAAHAGLAALDLDARLERAAEAGRVLEARAAEIVDSAVRECGQPRRFAEREMRSALGLIAALPQLAEAIRPTSQPAVSGTTTLEFAPYGVVFGWHAANSPVWVPTVVTQSALVAGNTVVSRPSSRARATTGRVLECLAQAWPPGSIVSADVDPETGQRVIIHDGIDAVVAHSSTETCKRHLTILGEAYARGARLRPYIPEASGNDALIVLDGADLTAAADAAAVGAFANGGQLCMSAKRIIVERSVADAFIAALVDRVAALVVGDADDARTDVAPIAGGPARDRARDALADALERGGRCLVGGDQRDEIIAPTIVQLPRAALKADLWRRESFAPLRSLVVADDAADAIALANDSQFGIGVAVFGPDDVVVDDLVGARVVVNTPPLYNDAHLVVGGVRDSGVAGARPKLEQLVFARRIHREPREDA